MQFHPNSAPQEIGPLRIRRLHLALNSPVVALDDFPVGPARAGVALSEGPERALHLEIAVRSVRTGQLRFYCSDDPIADDAAVVERALSFAEGMGFLFDDDEVATRGEDGERECAVLWRELVGDACEVAPPPPASTRRVVPVGEAPERPEPIRVDTAPAAAPAAMRLALSKFRLVLAASLAGPETADPECSPGLPPVPAAETDRNRLLSRF